MREERGAKKRREESGQQTKESERQNRCAAKADRAKRLKRLQ